MDYVRDRFNCFRILTLMFLLTPSIIYAETTTTAPHNNTKKIVKNTKTQQTVTESDTQIATSDTETQTDVLDTETPTATKDPLEKLNRFIFSFNDKVDTIILKPIATLYNRIMPHPLNRGVHNFFMNINNVPTVVNDVLQLHFQQAANDAWRFGINSTIGIGGLFDVAKGMGLQPYSNDFGLTLAHYGWKDSTFLVVPFFGPNTIRDGGSVFVDIYAFSVYPYIEPPSLGWQLFGLGIVDSRAQLLQYQSVLDEAAVDKYAFQRNAYLQRRIYKMKQNEQLGEEKVNTNEQPLDDASFPGVNLGS